jgi:predicted DNA-binding transcriptional regulator AlpA
MKKSTDSPSPLSASLRNAPQEHQLLDENDVATLLKLSVSSVQKMRERGTSPPYFKIGASCRYRLADVSAWLERHITRSTSDATARQTIFCQRKRRQK